MRLPKKKLNIFECRRTWQLEGLYLQHQRLLLKLGGKSFHLAGKGFTEKRNVGLSQNWKWWIVVVLALVQAVLQVKRPITLHPDDNKHHPPGWFHQHISLKHKLTHHHREWNTAKPAGHHQYVQNLLQVGPACLLSQALPELEFLSSNLCLQ